MKPSRVADYRERVYKIVRRIPRGKLMTYGQIAGILGQGYTPRTVGFAMHSASEADLPWQRVINNQGICSTARILLPADKQQRLLESEGVQFDERGRCRVEAYRWWPRNAARTSAQRTPSLYKEFKET